MHEKPNTRISDKKSPTLDQRRIRRMHEKPKTTPSPTPQGELEMHSIAHATRADSPTSTQIRSNRESKPGTSLEKRCER